MGQTYSQPTFLTEFAADDSAPTGDATAAVPGVGDDDSLVIPADLSSVADGDLAKLHSGAVDAFNALYGDSGNGLSDEDLNALSVLTDGIERVQTELDSRKTEQAKRADAATALAARAGVAPVVPAEGATSAAAAADTATADAAAAAEATKPAEIRVNLAGLRRNQTASSTSSMAATASEADKAAPKSMKDIVKATPDFTGFAADEGLDWSAIGKGIDRRLASFNRTQYEQANAANRHMRTQLGFAVINKPFEDDLIVKSSDPIHIDEILHRAAKESRLPGNSLVAAGGWCAPSQTVYDLLELESRDGLYSLPEIGITRGGIHFTSGPDFASIYANTGFSYNETQDIAGDYNGAGGGSKPCYEVACPPFSEQRLSYDGVCISAGLLQQRGYPEVIARTVRGALVAHDHKLAGHVLGAVVAGSDAVSMAANQVGATAPILTAIDLQVEHYRNVTRLGRNVSLEAVFPFWVRGAIRADLARRLGVDLLDVSDARIDGWFADRGVAPQYVYNWQDLTGAASTVTAFPTSVEFLLYAAGTWVKGGADIITLDTIYDSVKLGTNDFTALFSEEGWLVAKMGHDSRVVTVPICPDGATHGGVSIDCNGAQSATAQV